MPDQMHEYDLQPGQTVLDVLMATKMVASKSDGRRMLEQKGVRLDGEVLEKYEEVFPHTGVLQVGKRRFIRVK
jgi:tyrosyl-tRNA synthetase